MSAIGKKTGKLYVRREAVAECPFSIKMLDEAPFDMIDSPLSSCRENRHVYALLIYGKNEQDDLTPDQKKAMASMAERIKKSDQGGT